MATESIVGNFKISVIPDNVSPLRRTSDVFPDVAYSHWNQYRNFALTQEGLLQSQWRGHLVRPISGTGPLVLVDTGAGPGPHDHTKRNGKLLDNLLAQGVAPDDIDHVVITHTHFDHIGWNVAWDDCKPRPTFPNATYHVAQADWEYDASLENQNLPFRQSIEPLLSIADMNLVTGKIDIATGITIVPTNGHTPGHQCVVVKSEGKTGVLTGDLFHNVAQISEQAWCPVFDWNTEMSTNSRKFILRKAEREKWIVFSGHLANERSIGRVTRCGDIPKWEPI